jgi:dynactin 6
MLTSFNTAQNCVLTPKSIVPPREELADNTVIFSNGLRRVDRRGVADLSHKAQTRQIEILKRLIPSNLSRFKD